MQLGTPFGYAVVANTPANSCGKGASPWPIETRHRAGHTKLTMQLTELPTSNGEDYTYRASLTVLVTQGWHTYLAASLVKPTREALLA